MRVWSELRKVAEAASPGPWEVQTSCSWRRIGTSHRDGGIICPTNHHRDNHPDLNAKEADLNYIAAANPAVVLELLSDLSASLELLREYRVSNSFRDHKSCRLIPDHPVYPGIDNRCDLCKKADQLLEVEGV